MITKAEFLKDCGGHDGGYSSYMVVDVSLDDLIDALNEINPDMRVGSGRVSETGRSIYFEICKETPDLIGDITAMLHCRGFADMGAWYGEAYFTAYSDGEESDDFIAEWQEGFPERRDLDHKNADELSDEDIEWDCYITVIDKVTGEKFETGDGAVSYDVMLKWRDMVENH